MLACSVRLPVFGSAMPRTVNLVNLPPQKRHYVGEYARGQQFVKAEHQGDHLLLH